jgi:uncharacterized membrane protein
MLTQKRGDYIMTNTDQTTTAANTVDRSIEVDVPVAVVYNQWSDFESFPHFMNGVEEVVQTDETHTRWRISIAGVKREFEAVTTDLVPNERIAWNSIDGESHSGKVLFHSIDANRTRIEVEMGWNPQGVTEKLGAALQLDDIQVNQDLKNFKELIESNGFDKAHTA